MIERCCRHAAAIVTGIGSLRGAEVLWHPVINQGLVRFLDERAGSTEEDHDRRTDEVIAAILRTGEAFSAAQPGAAAVPCGSVSATGRPRKKMSPAL